MKKPFDGSWNEANGTEGKHVGVNNLSINFHRNQTGYKTTRFRLTTGDVRSLWSGLTDGFAFHTDEFSC